jgi:hypothetical protein
MWRTQLRAEDLMRALTCVGAEMTIDRMITILAQQREPELDDDRQIVERGATYSDRRSYSGGLTRCQATART